MRLLNFIVAKLLLLLIAGILFGYYFNIPLKTVFSIVTFLIILLFGLYIYYKLKYSTGAIFGVFAFITTFFIGVFIQTIHQKNNHPHHYTKFIADDEIVNIGFKVFKQLNSSEYYDRYEVNVIKVDNKKVSGRVILNVNRDSLYKNLYTDGVYITQSTFRKPGKPLNPGQFNYKSYLKKQHIYHQLYLKHHELILTSDNVNTIYGLAAYFRNHINEALKKHSFENEELAIINALLLGQRQDISEEVHNNYTEAGAIHILAVSGLHVGIILLLLNFILSPLENLKNGQIIKLMLILLFLWSFAIIAGLSASVVRAVTMFSFVAYAMHIKRATNIYNILAISMFFLLLFKPSFLFDVGFQLSYSAVFAIVWIQPLLYKWWVPKLRPVNYLWQLFTVTIAAQIGVIPLSLYYFHQFPGLFFISNLVIIPFLGIILGFGILVIVLALLNILPGFIADFYGSIISTMNNFIALIARQEDFLFRDIYFNWLLLITSYIFVICLVLTLRQFHPKSITALLVSVLILQITFIYNKYESQKNNRIIVFHKSRESLLGFHKNDVLIVSDKGFRENSIVKNYKIENNVETIEFGSKKDLYFLKDKKLLIVDSLGIYSIKNLNPDYVFLMNSPKVNLNRLIDLLKPKYIIADGSNYKSFLQLWEATCKKQKVPFHSTSEKGAFVMELK